MNLPAKKLLSQKFSLWLVRLIAPAIFLWSCTNNDPNLAVPNISNGDNLKAILTDTFLINTGTILRDSVRTSTATSLLVGKIEDQNFGRITCNSFVQTSITGDNFLNIDNPQYDSMILVLKPNYVFGNPDASIKMGVYRLKEGFEIGQDYFADNELLYDKEPLAEVVFSARDIQSENLRIDLSLLGEKFYNDRESNFFNTPLNFVQYFKGLAFITESSEGGVVGFEVDPASSTTSTLTSGIFFHYRTSVDSTADTAFYKFPISVNYQRFNQIIHDRPPVLSELKNYNQELTAQQTNDEAFLLSGTGIISTLQFPSFTKLRSLHENIIVEQAVLVIDGNVEGNDYYNPPSDLFLFKLDSNNNIELFENEEAGFGSSINNSYIIDVTSYFSALVSEKETITNFILLPTNNGSSINQLKFGAFKREESPIKLFVYYIPIE